MKSGFLFSARRNDFNKEHFTQQIEKTAIKMIISGKPCSSFMTIDHPIAHDFSVLFSSYLIFDHKFYTTQNYKYKENCHHENGKKRRANFLFSTEIKLAIPTSQQKKRKSGKSSLCSHKMKLVQEILIVRK